MAHASLAPEVEASVRAELARAGVPGAALAWVTRAGATGHLEHGLADRAAGTPVTPPTRFHLFSGTKLYTAATLVRLAEAGAVELDAPVRRYLPGLPLRPELTVAQLAAHASGLPDTLRAFLATHAAGEPAPSTGAALARYRLAGGRAPGGPARYGNVNYALLGELITRVAGVPYEEAVRRELLAPLGAELAFADDGRGSAVGYVGRFSPMWLFLRVLQPGVSRLVAARAGRLLALRPFSLDTAAIGGLVGAAGAFLPFLREMLSPDDGALRAASKRAMLRLRSHGAAGIVSRDGVGLGWKRGHVGERAFWNHEGGGAGFASETRLYPEDGIGLVLLMNLTHTAALSRLAHRVAERLRGALCQ